MTIATEVGALRDQAATSAAEISDTLASPEPLITDRDQAPSQPRWRDQSLAKGAAGIAVLHAIRARHGLGDEGRTHAWLTRATHDELSAGPAAGLWFGIPAVAFAVATAHSESYQRTTARLHDEVAHLVDARLEGAQARIDAALRPARAEFDLVHGLTGLGAYLLRQAPNSDLFSRVLTYLVRLTEPLPAADAAGLQAPGWWTNDLPSLTADPSLHGGHANFGMAHGIAGPLALLALGMRHGITVDGHAEAIDRICRWLDSWRQNGAAGAWWPEWITVAELRTGRSTQCGPRRPSWCYGTPGLARAQQLAGIALADQSRQDTAERALTRCLADPAQLARVVDPALCHGWAGLLTTASSAAADARSGDIAAQLPHLTKALLGHASAGQPRHQPGLIEGNAGTALALHSIATNSTDPWSTCLLLN